MKETAQESDTTSGAIATKARPQKILIHHTHLSLHNIQILPVQWQWG